MALNHMGQQIPVSTFNIGGGYYSPQQAQSDLAYRKFRQDQEDKERVFGREFAGDPPQAAAAPSSSVADAGGSGGLFGGFDLAKALQALSGASTDVSTTVADMNQQKKGTFDALAQLLSALGVSQNSLMGNLAQTAMSGKVGLTNADVDAQKANQAAALAASQANQARDTYAGKQALFQGLIGSNIGINPSADVTSRDVARPDTNVNLQALLQPEPPTPPPSSASAPFSLNTFMGGNRIKPMRPMIPAGAMA